MAGSPAKAKVRDDAGVVDRCVFKDDEIRAKIATYEAFEEKVLSLLPEKPTKAEALELAPTLKKLEEVQSELEILRARVDFCDFAELVMTDDETGESIRQAPIHRRWAELCSEFKHLIIWAHRSSGKTTQISVARTVWELGRDPTLRFLILSNTAEIAQRILKAIASLIEENVLVQKVFPHLKKNPKGPWTNTQLQVVRDSSSKDPSVRAAGIHGSVTSARIDRCIVDDILDFENTNTEAERRKTMGWYKATIPGCLTKRSRVIVVGTAYHPSDFIHEIARVKGYRWFRFPLISSNGTITWPEAWDEERIEGQRNELGPAEFARQFLCKARDDGEARFKQEWIDKALERGTGVPLLTSMQDLLAEMPEEEVAQLKVFTGVDLSTGKKKKKKTDLTSLFTLIQYPNGDRRVASIDAGKYTGPEIITRIEENHKNFGGVIAVEDNGCFPVGSRVLTIDGYKPIEEVNPGELVFTHANRWRKVLDTRRSIFSGNLVGLKVAGALPVWATPNHAFLVKESGRVQGSRTTLNVGKYRPKGESVWQSCSLATSAKMSDWAHYFCAPTPKWPDQVPVLDGRRYSSGRGIVVTKELALLLGLFLAEGSSSKKNNQVAFAFHQNEQYLRDFVRKTVEKVFRATSFEAQGDGQCVRIVVNSCELAQICRRMGKSVDKAMPFKWMGWPLSLRLAVVRGWLLGDGSLIYNNVRTHPSRHFCGSSISRNLIAQMRAILTEANFRPSLLPLKAKISNIGGRMILGKPAFKLSLCDDDSARLLDVMDSAIERVRWIKGRPAGRPRSKESGSPLIIENGALWGKLKDSSSRAYAGLVYNLVVEEDQSFIVEDIAAHNSQSYILQFAKSDSNVPVVPHTTSRAKRDPVLGVEGLSIELANGKWIIPRTKDNIIHPEVSAWITEMLFYDPTAHTGDRLMSCYFAREIARQYAGEARTSPRATMRVIGPGDDSKPDEVYRDGPSLRKLFDVPDAP